MQFWKVCHPEEVDDPDCWCTAYEASHRGAALAHFKYLVERDPCLEVAELTVWPEAGGVARTFQLRTTHVRTFSAEEMCEVVDA